VLEKLRNGLVVVGKGYAPRAAIEWSIDGDVVELSAGREAGRRREGRLSTTKKEVEKKLLASSPFALINERERPRDGADDRRRVTG
jgi:hypothetical protein